jgi:hypothetical protein
MNGAAVSRREEKARAERATDIVTVLEGGSGGCGERAGGGQVWCCSCGQRKWIEESDPVRFEVL